MAPVKTCRKALSAGLLSLAALFGGAVAAGSAKAHDAGSASVPEVGYNSFEDVVLASDKPVLVMFGAEWCGVCRRLEPELAGFAKQRPDWLVTHVDVDREPMLKGLYGVYKYPTLVILHQGNQVARSYGFAEAENLGYWVDAHVPAAVQRSAAAPRPGL